MLREFENTVELIDQARQYMPWASGLNDEDTVRRLQQLQSAYERGGYQISADVVRVEGRADRPFQLRVIASQPGKERFAFVQYPIRSRKVLPGDLSNLRPIIALFDDSEEGKLGYDMLDEIAPYLIRQVDLHPSSESLRNVQRKDETGDGPEEGTFIEGVPMMDPEETYEPPELRRLKIRLSELAADQAENLGPLHLVHIAEQVLRKAGYDLSTLSNDPKERIAQVYDLMKSAKARTIDLERLDTQLAEVKAEQQAIQIRINVFRTLGRGLGNWFASRFAPEEVKDALRNIADAASDRMILDLLGVETTQEALELVQGIVEIHIERETAAARIAADRQRALDAAAQEKRREDNKITGEAVSGSINYLIEKGKEMVEDIRDFVLDPEEGVLRKVGNNVAVWVKKGYEFATSKEGVGFMIGSVGGFSAGVASEYVLLSYLPQLIVNGNIVVGGLTLIGALLGAGVASKIGRSVKPTISRPPVSRPPTEKEE